MKAAPFLVLLPKPIAAQSFERVTGASSELSGVQAVWQETTWSLHDPVKWADDPHFWGNDPAHRDSRSDYDTVDSLPGEQRQRWQGVRPSVHCQLGQRLRPAHPERAKVPTARD